MPISSTQYCDACRALDFDTLFRSTSIPPDGLTITTIGKPIKPIKRPRTSTTLSCELCRFFHSLAPTYRRRHELHIRLFDCIARPWLREPAGTEAVSRRPFLAVLRKNSRLRYDEDIVDEVVQNGLTVFMTKHGRNDAGVLRVGPAVDFDLVHAQLSHCIDTHNICAHGMATATSLTRLLLIDCETGLIVERALDAQYLTLSYVWGQRPDQADGPTTSNHRLDEAPLTVRDAMTVVLRLGYRYFWVDRFCIDQDDTPNRAEMIANMDLIYEHSVATIVALHGDNDQAGLPGVSGTPRRPQACVACRSGILVSSCPPLATVIESSTWSTRGWTYQEARLSRRCIFFSSTQIYLACREHTWSEAVPYAPSSNSIAALLNSVRLDGELFGRKVISHEISRDRLMYTKRMLTFPSDALNAFRGILRRSRYTTFWGVPVRLRDSPANLDDSFALGLLWIKRPEWMVSRHLEAPKTGVLRRRGFPTWSWASLATEIHQDGHGEQSLYGQYLEGQAKALPYNEADITFSVEIDGNFEPLANAVRQSHSVFLTEASARLLVKGYMVSLPRRTRDEHSWYNLAGNWAYFRSDLHASDTEKPVQFDASEIEHTEDVLVLVQWRDAQRSSKTRFLLMLLDWIDDCRAERKGLLTTYRSEFDTDWVKSLPRTYKEFILQ